MAKKSVLAVATILMAFIGIAVAPCVIHAQQDCNGDVADEIIGGITESFDEMTCDNFMEIASRELLSNIFSSEGYTVFDASLDLPNTPHVLVYADLSQSFTHLGKNCFNAGIVPVDGSDVSKYTAEIINLLGYSFAVINVFQHEDIHSHAVVAECLLEFDLTGGWVFSYSYEPLVATCDDVDAYIAEVFGLMNPSRGPLYSFDLDYFVYDPGTSDGLSFKVYPLIKSLDFEAIEKRIVSLQAQALEKLVYIDVSTTISLARGAVAAYLNSLRDASVTVNGKTYSVSSLETIASELDDEHVLVLSDTVKIDLAKEPPEKLSDFGRWAIALGAAVALAASVCLSFIPAVGPYLGAAVVGASVELIMDSVIFGNKPDLGRCIMSAVVGALCVIPGVGLLGGAVLGGAGEYVLAISQGASNTEALTAFAIGSTMGLVLGGLAKGLSSIHHLGGGHVNVATPKDPVIPTNDPLPSSKAMVEVLDKNTPPLVKAKSSDMPDIDPVREPARFEAYKREMYGYRTVDDLPPVPVLKNFEKGIGKWTGEAGNSIFVLDKSHPKYAALKEIFEKYGVKGDGIRYVNGNPDFSAFAKLRINGEIVDTSVVIPDMKPTLKVELPDGSTKILQGRSFNQAKIPTNRNAWEVDVLDSDASNYLQADRALAKKLDTTPDQVRIMREKNGLTWHECADGITVELIPTPVHDVFKHCGGVYQMKNLYSSAIERDFTSIIKTKFGEGAKLADV